MNKTRKKNVKKNTERVWYEIDAGNKVLGRLSTRIAVLLMGKDKPGFVPYKDSGAGVIVKNCVKVRVTGKKASTKKYKRFSGYPGGLKETIYEQMAEKNPKYIIRHAVKGMLPKNKLGARMLKRLKIYEGDGHPHVAQKPMTG